MAKEINLEDENRKVLHYGFNSSVIYNKLTGKQEFIANSEIGIPNRPRFTYKFR